ncbi:MAG TPA: cytochrome o ubiquinol oxidase subunit III [Candidatus Saccharimonadales bacterium]|nr:cytochrome o ubiquinol oxidase subunit III [Candidatus Saccharimonadales bacterium]
MDDTLVTTLREPTAREMRRDADARVTFGFWVYLMTDCVLFASLFAVYAVLHGNTYGGPSTKDLFDLPYAFAETLILLTSSFTCGLAVVAVKMKRQTHLLFWLYSTLLLGCSFLILEVAEFRHFLHIGAGWRSSGFLSSYFTLVGTHGLHITVGLVWVIALMVKLWRGGLTDANMRRLTLFSMFWHFLDVVWIFIFAVVYLFGVLPL